VKKYSDLEKESQNKIREIVEQNVALTGVSDPWDSSNNGALQHKNILGLCDTCVHLGLAEMEYGNIVAKCFEFQCRLSGNNKIKECTLYRERGKLLLEEMIPMAYLINTKKNTPVGF